MPDSLRRGDRHRHRRARAVGQPAVGRQAKRARGNPRRGPLRLRHPAPRRLVVVRGGGQRLLHPGAQDRLVHDAGRFALQPMIPPAQALLQEADRRPGLRHMRDKRAPMARSVRAAAPSARRAGAGSRSCRSPPSRRRRTRHIRSRKSPRRRSPAANKRRGAGARSIWRRGSGFFPAAPARCRASARPPPAGRAACEAMPNMLAPQFRFPSRRQPPM